MSIVKAINIRLSNLSTNDDIVNKDVSIYNNSLTLSCSKYDISYISNTRFNDSLATQLQDSDVTEYPTFASPSVHRRRETILRLLQRKMGIKIE